MDVDLTFFCKHQHPNDPFTGPFLQDPHLYTLFSCQVGLPTKENEVQMVWGGEGVRGLPSLPAPRLSIVSLHFKEPMTALLISTSRHFFQTIREWVSRKLIW